MSSAKPKPQYLGQYLGHGPTLDVFWHFFQRLFPTLCVGVCYCDEALADREVCSAARGKGREPKHGLLWNVREHPLSLARPLILRTRGAFVPPYLLLCTSPCMQQPTLYYSFPHVTPFLQPLTPPLAPPCLPLTPPLPISYLPLKASA